jgi:hypothetical protein
MRFSTASSSVTALPAALLAAFALLLPLPADAQGVIVDQGRFDVSYQGQRAGTEDFSIRTAGIGPDQAIFANATVTLNRAGGTQEIRPLLRATAAGGVPVEYQIEVVGVDALELGLRRVTRRYVATIRSESGEEQREFPAAADTRILEPDVAHLYYFLRETAPGAVTPVIEPRSRTRVQLTTGTPVDEQIVVGSTSVATRRVEYTAGEDSRWVWFDALGRVLRVEVPATGYVAVRTDALR